MAAYGSWVSGGYREEEQPPQHNELLATRPLGKVATELVKLAGVCRSTIKPVLTFGCSILDKVITPPFRLRLPTQTDSGSGRRHYLPPPVRHQSSVQQHLSTG